MRKNLENIAKIDNYILGKLSEKESIQFESLMAKDKTLQDQVESQKLIIQAIKRKGIRKDIKKAGSSGGSNLFIKLGGFVIILALSTFFFFF